LWRFHIIHLLKIIHHALFLRRGNDWISILNHYLGQPNLLIGVLQHIIETAMADMATQ
jgi:hypothetical protein